VQQVLSYAEAGSHVGDGSLASPLQQPNGFTLEVLRVLLSLSIGLGFHERSERIPSSGGVQETRESSSLPLFTSSVDNRLLDEVSSVLR
jgi:hypothetical protein